MTHLALEGLDGKYVDIGVEGVTAIVLLALAVCLVAYYFLRNRVERKAILVIFALFLVAYLIRLAVLLRNPLIYGIDGPWYVSKVQMLLEQGQFGEFVAPLVLYFTTGLSVFVGDATLGIKIAQAFLSALPVLTIWLLVKYITKNNLASHVAALLVALSAMTIGMSDVLRNTGALAFLPLFYLFFLKFVNGEGRDWTIKTPLKIRGKRLGLALNTNLILTIIFFLLIIGCHFLTAGFAIMTVVAYTAFFTGYRRKIPWRELKFLAFVGALMLAGMVVSSSLRLNVLGTANSLSVSEPVPSDIFPFSAVEIPTPGGGADGNPPGGMFTFFLPFILLSLPAMWFILRHKDRRYLLFPATILLALLCSQDWIVNYMYTFRFMIMMYIALFVLMGISIWYIRKRLKKVAVGVLAGAVVFSVFSLVGLGATAGAYITQQEWTELRSISQQLPENSVILAPGMGERLFYWGDLLFEQNFQMWGPPDIEHLAGQIRNIEQDTGTMCFVVVEKDLPAGVENLEDLGLQILDNLKETGRYCVLTLAENSDGAKQGSAAREADEFPAYPGADTLQISVDNVEETFFSGEMDLSAPGVSVAVYSTTDNYSVVLSWYKDEIPKQGWAVTYENGEPEHGWGTVNFGKDHNQLSVNVSGNPWTHQGNVIVLVESPAGMFDGPGGSGDGGHEEYQPAATSEIRFNSNPLFAFILLPIELVQGLHGTGVYGILKLMVALPLSVGLVGFLIGLASPIWRKLKKAGLKSPRGRK